MKRDAIITKWNSMSPRKRDDWVAEKVMGLELSDNMLAAYPKYRLPDYPDYFRDVPNYSTDIAAAWDVIQKMKDKGFSFTLGEASEKSGSVILGEANLGDQMCNFHIVTKNIFIHVFKETMPEAICLAALIAQGEGIEEYGRLHSKQKS